ncbi:prephenate dehydrogenase [Clostridiaceae bacterium 35-E11]
MDHFHEIAIIGMGLIGGSIALALKKSGYTGKIIGYDLCNVSLEKAQSMGAIDGAATDIEEVVAKADLVVLAVPVGHYPKILHRITPFIKKETVVTDVGSVKGYVVKAAEQHLSKDIQFIGGHPMAGSEKDGIQAASPYLYENAYYFLTPTENTLPETIVKLRSFIKALGAYPILIDPYEHDRVVAQISHIPHLTATMLVNMLDKNQDTSYLSFVGGGFRDTTRIASGNPAMWKDIFIFNKKGILEGIQTLEDILKEFKHMLCTENEQEILETLKKAKSIRDEIPRRLKDAMPPIYEIMINVEDRPGILGELTQLMGKNKINIKEIEIMHSREGEQGAIRLGFATEKEEGKALHVLKSAGYLK